MSARADASAKTSRERAGDEEPQRFVPMRLNAAGCTIMEIAPILMDLIGAMCRGSGIAPGIVERQSSDR